MKRPVPNKQAQQDAQKGPQQKRQTHRHSGAPSGAYEHACGKRKEDLRQGCMHHARTLGVLRRLMLNITHTRTAGFMRRVLDTHTHSVVYEAVDKHTGTVA